MDEYSLPYQPYPQAPLPEPPVGGPPAARTGRRLLPYLLAFGAIVIAAGGYLAGSAHARSGSGTGQLSTASAVNAAAATPAASSCQNPRRAVVGTLKAVTGTSFTVDQRGGKTVTVHTSSSTTIRKTETGALADIKNGTVVTVRGTSSGQNAITAAQVDLVDRTATTLPAPPPPPAPGSTTGPVRPRLAGLARGTVGNVTTTGFTVTEGNGTKVTVTTSATTKVVKTVSATLSQLTVGQPVAVGGDANTNGSIAASQVAQGQTGVGAGIGGFPAPGGFPGGPGRGFGGPLPGAGRAGRASSTTTPSSVA